MFPTLRVYKNAVGAAEIFAQRPVQIPAEHLAHGLEQQAMHLVVLKWSAEDDGHLASGVHALDDLPFNDARRRANTAVHRGFDTMDRRQTGQVTLDERLYRLHVKASDEHKREIAGVGEPALVEGHRSVEIH